jgi:hypothetical protein
MGYNYQLFSGSLEVNQEVNARPQRGYADQQATEIAHKLAD